MAKPENVGRFPLLGARENMMDVLRAPIYNGDDLRQTFAAYELTVFSVILDRRKALTQLSHMSEALAVCVRVRHDEISEEHFIELQQGYQAEIGRLPAGEISPSGVDIQTNSWLSDWQRRQNSKGEHQG